MAQTTASQTVALPAYDRLLTVQISADFKTAEFVIQGRAVTWPPPDREKTPAPSSAQQQPPPTAPGQTQDGFNWKGAISQSLFQLGIEHGLRLAQKETREALRGPFFRDWKKAVKGLRGWDDGGHFLANYIGHPLQGAVAAYIQIHNDPRGIHQQFGRSRAYWKSRMKALAYATAYSLQFEIGPISEASIGNVGKTPGSSGYVDLVITPLLGVALLVAEDAIDRFIIQPLESRNPDSVALRRMARMVLNPATTLAKLMRWRKFGDRDRPNAAPAPHTREDQKVELGVHFTHARFRAIRTTQPEPGVTPENLDTNESGIGARIGYQFNNYFGLETELSIFPFGDNEDGGRKTEMFLGGKLGRRGERVGLFAKARAGMVRFGEVFDCPAKDVDRCGRIARAELALDLGGVLEFYPSRRTTVRFDFGDLMIRFGERNLLDSARTGTFVQPSHRTHNFQFNIGYGVRL